MDVSIIISSWNVADHLRRCLQSIFSKPPRLSFEVIVVDNASFDQSSQIVLNEFPEAKLIVNEKNLGFSKAINRGAQEALGEFMLVIQPDVEVAEGAIDQLIGSARKLGGPAVVGGKLLNPDGSLQPGARRFPTLASQWAMVLKLHHLFPKLKWVSSFFADDLDFNQAQEVDQVTSASFLVPRQIWEQLNGLDPKFFVYHADADFCFRAKQSGFKSVYLPAGPIIHYGGQTFRKVMGVHRQMLYNRALRYFFRKHKKWLSYIILLLLQPLSFLFAFVVQLIINPPYKPKPRALASKKLKEEELSAMFKLK